MSTESRSPRPQDGSHLMDDATIQAALDELEANYYRGIEAAKVLGVSPAALSNWINRDRMVRPDFKLGKSTFYSRARIDRIAAALAD